MTQFKGRKKNLNFISLWVNFLLDENTEWYEKHLYLIFIDFQRSEITIEIFYINRSNRAILAVN
jgi:hypothetical protein